MRHYPIYLFLMLVSLVALATGCGSDDDPVAPAPTPAEKARIAIMNDDSTEVSVIAILEGAGYEVTDLGLYADYTGTDFSAYDLVFMLTGYEYGDVLPDSVQQGLLDFMDGGGTLVTNEWLGYSENNDLLMAMLPLTYNDDYCDDGDTACVDTITVDVSHALTKGLPATFLTPPDYTYSFMTVTTTSNTANIMSVMSGAIGGAALGVGDWGEGHTIHWNWAGVYAGDDIWDANTTMILLNIADFAR
jgi:hypothetical protein